MPKDIPRKLAKWHFRAKDYTYLIFKRTIPPAASPISFADLFWGLRGIFHEKRYLENFLKSLKSNYNVRHCFLLSSGTAALTIILRALKELEPGKSNIVIPGFTCYSVAAAATRAKLKIVLCDLEDSLSQYDLKQLRYALGGSTLRDIASDDSYCFARHQSAQKPLAVVYVHLFGMQPGINDVDITAKANDVYLIEDAAQAMGSCIDGTKAGMTGDVGFFSLGRGKPLSTVEGGIIITNNDRIGTKIKELYRHTARYSSFEQIKLIAKALAMLIFQHPSFFWLPKHLAFLKLGETIYDPGFKIRKMTGFQAGLAKNWQKKIKIFDGQRKRNVNFWLNRLNFSKIAAAAINNHHFSAMVRFPILVLSQNKREKIISISNSLGLGIMPTYPDYIGGIKELKQELACYSCENSRKYARTLLTLPVHIFLSISDKKKILNALRRISEKNTTN